MLLIIHITVALISVGLAGFMYFFPSKNKLKLTTFLAMATLGSGSYLLITTPSHLLQSCLVGTIYLGIVVSLILSARHKLSKVFAP